MYMLQQPLPNAVYIVPCIQLNKGYRTKGARVITNCLRFLFVFRPPFSRYRRNCSTFPRLKSTRAFGWPPAPPGAEVANECVCVCVYLLPKSSLRMCVNRKARAQCRFGCEGTSVSNLTKVLEP